LDAERPTQKIEKKKKSLQRRCFEYNKRTSATTGEKAHATNGKNLKGQEKTIVRARAKMKRRQNKEKNVPRKIRRKRWKRKAAKRYGKAYYREVTRILRSVESKEPHAYYLQKKENLQKKGDQFSEHCFLEKRGKKKTPKP